MKKFISGAIVGAIFASSISFAAQYMAEPATFKVMVNGKEFNSDPPALVVEGRTYLPLRAMGNVLGVPVEWNGELNQAEVGIITNYDSTEISNYIIGTVWNKGFWWIKNYIDGSYTSYADMYTEQFANSPNEIFDINKIVKSVLDTKATINSYNSLFTDNEKWVAFNNEYSRLYDIVENGTYSEDNFNTTFFEKVRDEFLDSID